MTTLEYIEEIGEKIRLQSNASIRLCEEGMVWFIKKGSVNLFAIERVDNQNPEGIRTFLETVSGPFTLFSIPLSEYKSFEIVAITETECLIYKVPLVSLEEQISGDPNAVNQWIHCLATIYEKEFCSRADHYIEELDSIQLNREQIVACLPGSTIAERKAIHWVDTDERGLEFLGYSSLILPPGPFPLTAHAWLKSEQQIRLRVCEPTSCWKRGLYNFHQVYLQYLAIRKKNDEKQELQLAQKRQQIEEEALHLALQKMGSVLNPIDEPIITSGKEWSQILYLACTEIGKILKINIHYPESLSDKSSISEILSIFTKTSDVRYRFVKLLGKWWKRDSGPLLAFYGLDQQPVALLVKKRGYEMFDPKSGLRTVVDQTIAKNLSVNAYVFYATFPLDLKTGKEVFHFYWKHNKKEFVPIAFYSLLAAIIALFPPYATAKLMNRVVPSADYTLLIQIAIALVMAAIGTSLFIFFRSLLVARLEGSSSNQLQMGFWDRLLRLPVSFFHRFTTGNLILRVMAVDQMRSLLSGNVIRLFFSGIMSGFYLIAMLFYAPALALITMLAVAISLLFNIFFGIIFLRMQRVYYEIAGKINAYLIEIITAVGKLRTAGAEKSAFAKWAEQFAEYKKIELRSRFIANFLSVSDNVLPFLMYAAIFAYVLYVHSYSIGAFLAFNTAFVSFYVAIREWSNVFLTAAPIIPLWERSKVIIQEPLEERVHAQSPGRLSGEIRIDEVSFRYPGNETDTLHNISLRAASKEFIGLVGPSGSGKSTLIRLLLGFEKPHKGAIYYDRHDLSILSLQEVRRQLGVVLQGEGIIAGSLYDNLVCGARYTPEEVERALKISGFIEDVESFPMGLNTHLTMGGSTLSGGQRQRLLIARAILPKPNILLLDEATSALDTYNQKQVIESINRLDVTRIVIAHRLSTIKNADRIYVIQNGEIIQTGTFDELASQKGLFAHMLQRQSLT